MIIGKYKDKTNELQLYWVPTRYLKTPPALRHPLGIGVYVGAKEKYILRRLSVF